MKHQKIKLNGKTVWHYDYEYENNRGDTKKYHVIATKKEWEDFKMRINQFWGHKLINVKKRHPRIYEE